MINMRNSKKTRARLSVHVSPSKWSILAPGLNVFLGDGEDVRTYLTDLYTTLNTRDLSACARDVQVMNNTAELQTAHSFPNIRFARVANVDSATPRLTTSFSTPWSGPQNTGKWTVPDKVRGVDQIIVHKVDQIILINGMDQIINVLD